MTRMLPDDVRNRYTREDGDTVVRVRDLGPDHKDRVFVARDLTTGEGTIGYLSDVTVYPLVSGPGRACAVVQFRDEPVGYFATLDGVLVMKPEGFTAPGLTAP